MTQPKDLPEGEKYKLFDISQLDEKVVKKLEEKAKKENKTIDLVLNEAIELAISEGYFDE